MTKYKAENYADKEIAELFNNYKESAEKSLHAAKMYRYSKALKYLMFADPDMALKPEGYKKPSESIIEARLDTDEELNKLRLNMELAKVNAFLDKQALLLAVGGKDE